jgi:hypothetical protein
MKFQVTQIEFDFSSDDPTWGDVDPDYQKEITEETISQIWEADDAEHLVDKISDETGWCIKSIDYSDTLNEYHFSTVFIPGILS